MKLSVSREDLGLLAVGVVSARLRERAKRLIDPVPSVIPGQIDIAGGEEPSNRTEVAPDGGAKVVPRDERSDG